MAKRKINYKGNIVDISNTIDFLEETKSFTDNSFQFIIKKAEVLNEVLSQNTIEMGVVFLSGYFEQIIERIFVLNNEGGYQEGKFDFDNIKHLFSDNALINLAEFDQFLQNIFSYKKSNFIKLLKILLHIRLGKKIIENLCLRKEKNESDEDYKKREEKSGYIKEFLENNNIDILLNSDITKIIRAFKKDEKMKGYFTYICGLEEGIRRLESQSIGLLNEKKYILQLFNDLLRRDLRNIIAHGQLISTGNIFVRDKYKDFETKVTKIIEYNNAEKFKEIKNILNQGILLILKDFIDLFILLVKPKIDTIVLSIQDKSLDFLDKNGIFIRRNRITKDIKYMCFHKDKKIIRLLELKEEKEYQEDDIDFQKIKEEYFLNEEIPPSLKLYKLENLKDEGSKCNYDFYEKHGINILWPMYIDNKIREEIQKTIK